MGTVPKHGLTMAQNTVNWLTWIAGIHSHTLHQHSHNHVVASASSAITEFGLKFYFEVILGGGANQ